ncbi:MAG: hypothetical protein HY201_05340 [Nitrospirae bacterium]|nr:hypothetical protein [Candidatus Troglogloeales bacterium]MBI3598852.1 hypothetical protein [Candidatus Troglogloeales bacterium]
MFTTLKRAALIGLGVSERAKEALDTLAQKGEANSSEGARKIRAFLESGEKVEAECSQKVEDICNRVAQTIRIPSRADIERLEKGLADLAAKVHGMPSPGGK